MTRPPSSGDLSPRAPAFRLAFYVVLGILTGSQTHFGPLFWGSLSATLCILITFRMRNSPGTNRAPSLIAGILLISCGAFRFVTVSGTPPALPPPFFAPRVLLTGEVIAPPEERSGRFTFLLLADTCFTAGRATRFPVKIAVSVRRLKREQSLSPVTYGMHVLLEGRLAEPPAERNPGEFSPRAYDNIQGICGVLEIEGLSGIVIRDSSGGDWFMKRWVYPAREEILRRAGELVGGEEGEFLKDLLVGERAGIPEETREAFLESGVAHVLAVSGYRVLVFAGMLTCALTLLRIPRFIHPFIALPALLFYAALAGAHAPVVRASVMSLVLMAGRRLERVPNSKNALGVAALVVLGGDPRQLFDAGFQLSFEAVLALIVMMPVVRGRVGTTGLRSPVVRRWVVEPAAVSLIVSLSTLPVTAACFGYVSPVGLLTNILVVPATGAGMICGTVALGADALHHTLGAAYGALDENILRATIRFSEYAASLPFATVETGGFGLPETVAWYAAIGLIACARERRKRAACIALLLAALNAAVIRSPDPATTRDRDLLRLSMIDVGQGDAFLVEFPGGGALLIDAGPRTLHTDAGKKIVAPFLRRRGIRRVDLLVVSHPDADHAGGAGVLMRRFVVSRVAASVDSVLGGDVRVDSARSGLSLAVPECARLYCLWPPQVQPSRTALKARGRSNNASVVVKLVYGSVSFLFTGDAEKESESAMIRAWGGFLRSTVLKVAHHGSESGTSAEFLDAVRPRLALLSVGLHNNFGHPSPGLLLRLAGRGVAVRRTDREGAVILTSDGRSLREISWRPAFP